MKTIMVVGCGRSGTLYMTELFKTMGIDVGHERLGQHGISSWFHSFGARQKRLIQKEINPAERYMIHLVRNPIDVINSMIRVSRDDLRYAIGYFKDICPDAVVGLKHELEIAMKYWWFWNKMTEIRGAGIDVRIRVEDLQNEETLFMLCEELGLHYGHRVREKVVALGTKIHEYDAGEKFEFTIENMVRTNPLLTKQIEQLAQEYGYDFRADIDG